MRSPRFSHRYWQRLGSITLFAVMLVSAGLPAGLGVFTTCRLLYRPCDEHATTPGDFGRAYEDVTFDTPAGAAVRAYFVPGTRRAAVIIPPTTNGGRGTRLHVMDLLARHGYAVLTFESRRCAGMGPLSLGYKEADDIGAALAYLQTRDDVHSDRIAVLGFSSAGAAAIMAAARYPALQAVIAEGGYSDFAGNVIGLDHASGTVFEAMYKQSMSLTYRAVTGLDIHRLSPVDVIGQIAPRPILLIYGSEESSLAGAYEQLGAAGDNAGLWVVEGAGHGGYLAVAPADYEARVIAFLDQALVRRGMPTDD